MGYHKTAKLVELGKRAKLFAVTNLQPEILNAISIAPYKQIQDAFDDATRLKGRIHQFWQFWTAASLFPEIELGIRFGDFSRQFV